MEFRMGEIGVVVICVLVGLTSAYEDCGTGYYCEEGYCCRGGYECCTSYVWGAGSIAGAVIGSVFFIALMCGLGCCCRRRYYSQPVYVRQTLPAGVTVINTTQMPPGSYPAPAPGAPTAFTNPMANQVQPPPYPGK